MTPEEKAAASTETIRKARAVRLPDSDEVMTRVAQGVEKISEQLAASFPDDANGSSFGIATIISQGINDIVESLDSLTTAVERLTEILERSGGR